MASLNKKDKLSKEMERLEKRDLQIMDDMLKASKKEAEKEEKQKQKELRKKQKLLDKQKKQELKELQKKHREEERERHRQEELERKKQEEEQKKKEQEAIIRNFSESQNIKIDDTDFETIQLIIDALEQNISLNQLYSWGLDEDECFEELSKELNRHEKNSNRYLKALIYQNLLLTRKIDSLSSQLEEIKGRLEI